MDAEAELSPPLPAEVDRLTRQQARAEAVEKAVELIKGSRLPIMLVGQGAFTSRAHDAVGALARTLQCPILHTYPVSSFPEGLEDRTFPFGFTPASLDAAKQAALVIPIGDRKGVGVGRGGAYRLDSGGGGIIKKK